MTYKQRTDLAAELNLSDDSGIAERHEMQGAFSVSTVEIKTEAAERRLSKPRGKYITVDIGKIWLAADSDFDSCAEVISDKLRLLASELCGEIPESVFIVGLGNRHITADALGDEIVSKLTATRHLRSHRTELFTLLGGREISAIAPGVLGQTGIESAELVLGVCREIKPKLVVAIDSLCARSTERLATTVQLGSSGITPGSGVGNHRHAIDKNSLGVPVIALGVPTVVDSSTLVVDALEKAGISEIDDRLQSVLDNGRDFFVTPKETDTIIKELSRLLSKSLAMTFGGLI